MQDPSLPINMDYSPELDPEIHGFLRQQHHNRGPTQEGRGSAATHCELRIILDGLEKLGFQLITTASYTFQGRSHNEFIMHRDSTPADSNISDGKRHQYPVVVANGRNKHEKHQHVSQPSYGNERREHGNERREYGNERREQNGKGRSYNNAVPQPPQGYLYY